MALPATTAWSDPYVIIWKWNSESLLQTLKTKKLTVNFTTGPSKEMS